MAEMKDITPATVDKQCACMLSEIVILNYKAWDGFLCMFQKKMKIMGFFVEFLKDLQQEI